MAVFFGHTPLTEKNGHTVFYGFFSTTCRKSMGFIRVIYANDRKIMAIRANTAKYGSLTEKKQPYGVPGRPNKETTRFEGFLQTSVDVRSKVQAETAKQRKEEQAFGWAQCVRGETHRNHG